MTLSNDSETPTKKPRAAKKGTAQKVKKATPRPRETLEEVTSSEEEEDEEKEKEKKPSSKGARSKSKSVPNSKGNKANEAKKLAPENANNEKDDDKEGEEVKVEMGFDQA